MSEVREIIVIAEGGHRSYPPNQFEVRRISGQLRKLVPTVDYPRLSVVAFPVEDARKAVAAGWAAYMDDFTAWAERNPHTPAHDYPAEKG